MRPPPVQVTWAWRDPSGWLAGRIAPGATHVTSNMKTKPQEASSDLFSVGLFSKAEK